MDIVRNKKNDCKINDDTKKEILTNNYSDIKGSKNNKDKLEFLDAKIMEMINKCKSYNSQNEINNNIKDSIEVNLRELEDEISTLNPVKNKHVKIVNLLQKLKTELGIGKDTSGHNFEFGYEDDEKVNKEMPILNFPPEIKKLICNHMDNKDNKKTEFTNINSIDGTSVKFKFERDEKNNITKVHCTERDKLSKEKENLRNQIEELINHKNNNNVKDITLGKGIKKSFVNDKNDINFLENTKENINYYNTYLESLNTKNTKIISQIKDQNITNIYSIYNNESNESNEEDSLGYINEKEKNLEAKREKISNFLLKNILQNLSPDFYNCTSIFHFNKGENFESNFYEFLDLNSSIISSMFNSLNTQYMRNISEIFSNLSQKDQESQLGLPDNFDVIKMNNHQLTLFIFFIGCYIQDIIKDQKEQIYNTESNRNIKFGFDEINDIDYDFIKDRSKFLENVPVFHFINNLSNDDISDLLNDINNSYLLISGLIKSILTGYARLFSAYEYKYKLSNINKNIIFLILIILISTIKTII